MATSESDSALKERMSFNDKIYIFRPDELLVSVVSQQMRALKLVRALYQ